MSGSTHADRARMAAKVADEWERTYCAGTAFINRVERESLEILIAQDLRLAIDADRRAQTADGKHPEGDDNGDAIDFDPSFSASLPREQAARTCQTNPTTDASRVAVDDIIAAATEMLRNAR